MPEKIALLSDIHGNTPALRAVLRDVAREHCARVYVLGDIINGVDPNGCVELIQSISTAVCIRGNAEAYLLTPDLDEFPKRHEPMFADLIGLLRWWHARLSPRAIKWLEQFPDTWRWNGAQLVHDSPFDRLLAREERVPGIAPKYQELVYHGRGISPRTSADEFAKLFAWVEAQNLSGIFCGHTHEPFCKWLGNRFICNAGSVGMPLDGDPRPAWVLLEDTGKEPGITIRRVDYAIEEMMTLIDATPDYPDFKDANFKSAYKMMLTTGTHWRAYMK